MTLLIEKYNYTKLTRDESTGKRLYATPEGHKVPSVTTILDKTKPAESRIALANWRKAVGEKKAQEITTEAANRGTRMHKYLEDYVTQGFLSDPGSNPFSQQSHKMADCIIKQGFGPVTEVWGNEVPLYFPELYAGTTDCVGVHNGEQSILDYKQTNKPKKLEYIEDYFIQLTAYALAHNEMFSTNIRKVSILMVDRESKFGDYVIKDTEFDHYCSLWADRVALYYSR